MGTTLTGTTPQDTYEALIKVGDNGIITGSLKTLSDGEGNDTALALSTGAASITGTLAVSGNAAFDTDVLFVDVANDRVGIGTASPAFTLDVNGVIRTRTGTDGIDIGNPSGNSYRANALLRGTNAVGASSVSYIGVNVFNTAGSLDITSGADVIIRNDSTERARFLATGGLTFNGDTAAANALDDYEEGTWTIGVSFDNASVGVTASHNAGTYTKIGGQVTVNGFLILTSKGSSTGIARVTGLPFTVPNNDANHSTPSIRLQNITFANQFEGNTQINTTTIRLQEITEAGTVTNLTNTDFANDSNIMVSLTYFV